jgi:hypothetical protein
MRHPCPAIHRTPDCIVSKALSSTHKHTTATTGSHSTILLEAFELLHPDFKCARHLPCASSKRDDLLSRASSHLISSPRAHIRRSCRDHEHVRRPWKSTLGLFPDSRWMLKRDRHFRPHASNVHIFNGKREHELSERGCKRRAMQVHAAVLSHS